MDNSPRSQEELIALLEAFLFHYGEPIGKEKVEKALKLKKGELQPIAEGLKSVLSENPRSGIILIDHDGELQLVTKPEFQDARKTIIEEEWKTELTPAAQETLSLVAYLGPVSKMMIDYIRGVNSGFTLRNLLLRGLVERAPSESHPHSYDYHVSFEFLRHMGLEKIEGLPDYEKYHSALQNFAVGGEDEAQDITPTPVLS